MGYAGRNLGSGRRLPSVLLMDSYFTIVLTVAEEPIKAEHQDHGTEASHTWPKFKVHIHTNRLSNLLTIMTATFCLLQDHAHPVCWCEAYYVQHPDIAHCFHLAS